jgi:transcriptional regulator with XRE-family HTH domain
MPQWKKENQLIMFSKIIKTVRCQRKETQQMMADKLGVSQRTVASWESGTRMPSYETLLQIANLYQVSTDYLLGRDLFQHHVMMPSGKIVTILTTETEPPTDEELGLLGHSVQTTLNENLVTVFPDADQDQLQAFDAYIRQVVRSVILSTRDMD